MGVNRFRRSRFTPRDKTRKFTSAQVSSAKHEAQNLLDLVDDDVRGDQYLYYADQEEGSETPASITLSEDVVAVEDRVLYEMGILYDTPLADPLPGIEVDPDWDMVSVVSEQEWDVVSVDDGLSDDESWG